MSSEDTPKLWQVIQAAVARGAHGIRTGLPGRIESYDAATNKATVQALIPDGFYGEDGSREALPIAQMTDVPVELIGWGDVHIKGPIKKGMPCWLEFSSSCLTGWKQGGTRVVDPGDDRRHHEADVVARMAVFIDPKDATAAIEFTDDGQIHAGGSLALPTMADFNGIVSILNSAGVGSATNLPGAVTAYQAAHPTWPAGTAKLKGG